MLWELLKMCLRMWADAVRFRSEILEQIRKLLYLSLLQC